MGRASDMLVEAEEIFRGIDSLTSGENNLGKLSLDQLEKHFKGSVTDSLDIRKIANVANVVRNATGANLNLGGIANIADCVKNLDDLLIEKVKQEVMNKILETDTAQEIVEKLGEISAIAKEGGNLLRQADEIKEKSLAELLVDAKNAGLLDKVKIIKDINDKFGGVVDNLNDIISKLNSFNPCNMLNVSGGGTTLPPPLQIGPRAAPAHPDPGPVIIFNKIIEKTKGDFMDHTNRAGDLIEGIYSETDLESDPSYGSMLTALNSFYYGVKSEAITGGESELKEKSEMEIQRIVDSKRDEWSGDLLNEFKERATNVSNLIVADVSVLQADDKLRNA